MTRVIIGDYKVIATLPDGRVFDLGQFLTAKEAHEFANQVRVGSTTA